MIVFRQTNPAAGWLMLPYFLWVSYASTLNAGIWWLHRK
jgi:tryptophan-rich sensory protein